MEPPDKERDIPFNDPPGAHPQEHTNGSVLQQEQGIDDQHVSSLKSNEKDEQTSQVPPASQNEHQQTQEADNPKTPDDKNKAKGKGQSKKPNQKPTYHGLCDVNFHYLTDSQSARRFLHNTIPTNITVLNSNEEVKGEKQFADSKQCFTSTLDLPTGTVVEEFESLLLRSWFRYQEQSEQSAWMEVIPKERRAYSLSYKHVSVSSIKSTVFGGAMTSPTVFVKHWSIPEMQVTFEHDKELLSISKRLDFGPEEVMEIPYNTLSDTVVAHYDSNTLHLYIGLKNPPKLLEKTETKKRSFTITEEKRLVYLTSVGMEDIGCTSVLCFDISDTKTTQSSQVDMWTVVARLKRHGFSISYANVLVKTPEENLVHKVKFGTFDLYYAWECLLSCGYKVTDSFTPQSLLLLEERKPALTPEVFEDMTNSADNSLFFEFERVLINSMNKFNRPIVGDKTGELPSHYSMTRRIVVTPTRTIPLPKEPIVQNRIIRQYNDDFFIRVLFRDEDFTRLSASRVEGLKTITKRLYKFMNDGFEIGDRKYEFLACSNSQLREHGVWFFCSNNGQTAESIRSAVGDLTKERCVATYVSRMGLCFSASRATVEVDVDNGSVEYIDDIKAGKYCFTDGIGKISVPLAKKVAESLAMDPVPSAFQIRYGGCKGVVAQDPSLGDAELVHIRESMNKFESSSNVLEILQTTHPGQLYLNRQVITLMSGLGVPETVFMSMQEKMLFNMADMLLDNSRARCALAEVNIGIKYKDLMSAGITFTREAFFRSVLMTIYKRKLGDLIRKTRIEVNYDQGRIMMGTVDETRKLDYGQVFVSFTKHDGMNYKGIKVLEAEVVVAKNPCFHPGDLRKFQAVDVPELHHLIDCIVFPQRGSRPHPDEMSGSDLDGDMYFVCWDKKMHPPGENKEAMEFPNAPKAKLSRKVEVSDVTHFISEYIRNDQLGVIANAHVVHADQKDIFCKECIELSRKHSDAVDFPKTGVVPEMTADLRSEKYPDFMMKSDKPQYRSENILGKLYRQSRSLEQAHNRSYNMDLLQDAIVVDSDMMYPGYEKYIETAQLSYDLYNEKVLQLMSLYGIETEAEVVTGVIQKLKKKRGYLQNEKYEIEKIIKEKMSVIRKKVRAEFFQDFGREDDNSANEREEILAKASAWYVVAYNMKTQTNITGKRFVSFPWIISEFLSQIKANACPATSGDTKSKTSNLEGSELVQIGSSIVRHFDTRHENRFATFRFLGDNFNQLSDRCYYFLGPTVKNISLTGTPSLCLMDRHSREIDVCLELVQSLHNKDFENLLKNVFAGCRHVKQTSFVLQSDDVDHVTVTFHQDTKDKCRTNFIREKLQNSPSYTLILTFLLDWARKFKIIGRSRNAVLPEVVFTLLALKILSDEDRNTKDIRSTHASTERRHDFGSWFPEKMTPTKQIHAAGLLMAVLRNFCSLLSTDDKGDTRIDVLDPTVNARNTRCLVPGKLDWRKCKHLTEQILSLYQEIATNLSVNVFFEQNKILEEGHLMMNLPLEIWGSVMFAEAYTARRLSEESGAEISIRRITFRDTPGLMLEAWGTPEELWKVEQSLQELNDKSSKFITTSARNKSFICGAFKRLFHGSTSPDQQLKFNRYTGRCQPAHKELTLYIPYVDSPSGNNDTALKKFKEVFQSQMEIIGQDFEKTYHGDLRIALTFGTYYIFYVEDPQFTISELEMAFEGHVNPQEKQPEISMSGRRGWRTRKRHGRFTKPKPRHIRGTFMPTNCEKNNVSAFLGNTFFKERHEEVKYHATFRLGNLDYGKTHEGLVILDKDFRFTELRLADLKWMAVDVCRGYRGTDKRLDVRCKLHSRRRMDNEGVQEMSDTKVLLEPSTSVLLKPKPGVLYVTQEFRDRVPFVREKHVKSYKYDGPSTEYSIWQDMDIEIAVVFEYSLPDSSGRFTDMVQKQEVTVIPKLPTLDASDTDWDSYVEDIWGLIEHFGEQFDSD